MDRRLPALGLLGLWLVLCDCAGPRNGQPKWSGTIEAVEVDVVPEIAGRIIERPVDEGDLVQLGQSIATIDAEPYEIALWESEAAQQGAAARLRLLTAGYRKEEVEEALQVMNQAEAGLAQTEARLRRITQLVADGAATEDALDLARRDRDAGRGLLDQTRARHAQLTRGFRSEELEQARAEAQRLAAVVAARRLDLRRTAVISPLAGTVTEKLQEPGEYARPGSPIVSVADLVHLYTWVYPTALELPLIKLGDPVAVHVDAFPGRDFPGRVVHVSPQAEFTPKNVQTVEDRVQLVYGVKIAVDNPDGALKIGIPADVTPRAH